MPLDFVLLGQDRAKQSQIHFMLPYPRQRGDRDSGHASGKHRGREVEKRRPGSLVWLCGCVVMLCGSPDLAVKL